MTIQILKVLRGKFSELYSRRKYLIMLIDKNLIGERTRQEHEEEIKRLDKFINIIYEDIKKYEVLNDWKELIL